MYGANSRTIKATQIKPLLENKKLDSITCNAKCGVIDCVVLKQVPSLLAEGSLSPGYESGR